MEKELEVKVLNINKEEVEKKLKELGAKLIKKEFQRNTILDTDDRMIKNKENGYLRIREANDLISGDTQYIFTLKKNVSKDELRENIEINTRIEDYESLVRILKHLKLDVKHIGTKERVSYKYGSIRFDIDTWDKDVYPYPYLEIEVESKEDLEEAIELLDLDKKDVTSKSLGQLRMELGLGDL